MTPGEQDPVRRALAAALLVVGATAACTAQVDPGPTGGGGATTADSPSPSTSPSPTPVVDAAFARGLRRTLAVPPLPAFAIPTELLSGATSRRITTDLDVPPGLYQGIAVLDARCTAAGDATAADTGAPVAGPTRHFEDGTVSVTVGADGTGGYDTADLHIAVLGDGAGVYDDGRTRLSVAPDGSGTYSSGDLRYTVSPDGSGSYSDEDVRVWVDADGAGGYEDDTMRLSWKGTGEVYGDGEPARVAAVRSVLADGLPRFPPVPAVASVEPAGTVCGTVIRLDANVLFDVDQAEVHPGAQADLDRVAALLVALGSPRALVNGHTDTVGTEAHNLELSERRAEAVRDALVGSGADSGSLETHGLGESQPLRPDVAPDGSEDAAARQLNRRVEIVLLD
ncbi:OmpA family protein [uncultured Cellulomonas sp.]|uniref:OmpA family protein n=1 Tax=uncultured Cellulomonas sp. TaxID=189682 RepID=UPI00261F5167|nr:OmpA family protein [uncultured Cellulomonas sp.]